MLISLCLALEASVVHDVIHLIPQNESDSAQLEVQVSCLTTFVALPVLLSHPHIRLLPYWELVPGACSNQAMIGVVPCNKFTTNRAFCIIILYNHKK